MSHTITIEESNGNLAVGTNNSLTSSISNEDLSLSEYTDADESMSAPTEFLAEFLSAVMLKDYKKALKYCKLILQFEPNNITAKEFYPLIIEKINQKEKSSSDSDENDNTPSPSDFNEIDVELQTIGSGFSEPSNSGSESEDSSGDSEEEENHIDISNFNTSNENSASGGSDNTTHSYSSLLLEEEDEQPDYKHLTVDLSKDEFNGNGNYKTTSCSDSESPTEPLTQRIAAILRAKCIPPRVDEDSN